MARLSGIRFEPRTLWQIPDSFRQGVSLGDDPLLTSTLNVPLASTPRGQAAMAKPKYTKAQLDREYPDDGACLDAIMEMRYGGTDIKCPGCIARPSSHRIAKRRAYACQWCGHHIFPCVGTVFEKSRTPLTKWFYAMYLFTASRHGVPARELERQLGVTYKCAWRIAHELRKLMAIADYKGPMGGAGRHVEVDETRVGGVLKGTGRELARASPTAPTRRWSSALSSAMAPYALALSRVTRLASRDGGQPPRPARALHFDRRSPLLSQPTPQGLSARDCQFTSTANTSKESLTPTRSRVIGAA